MTQDQLNHAIDAFRREQAGHHSALVASMDKGFERVAAEIKDSESKWRERTHEIANNQHAHTTKLALHDREFEAQEKARASLWVKVGVFVPIGAAFTAWLVVYVMGHGL